MKSIRHSLWLVVIRQRSRSAGSAVVVILVLLSIMVIYSLAAAQSVLRLKEEIRHFEKKQLEKFQKPARSLSDLSRSTKPDCLCALRIVNLSDHRTALEVGPSRIQV